jgi:hypothetical protein
MEMKYVQDQELNKKVEVIIEELKHDLITNFKPQSIILSGSFGRGDASLVEKNGRPVFLSDCDISIIPYWYVFNRNKVNKFELNFYKKTGLKINIWGGSLSFYLLFPYLNKWLKPTMASYDLKYGSRVIYGKNYLKKIPEFKPKEIPLWEGIRLLFNRMAEALEHFSFVSPNEMMVFWIDKIILACQDALLLSLGRYHASPIVRNELFQRIFPMDFVDLNNELPNFIDFTIQAMARKSNRKPTINDPLEYWFDTREICESVFRYLIKKDMGLEFNDFVEFRDGYLSSSKIKEYSYSLLSSVLHQNFMDYLRIVFIFFKPPPLKLILNKIPYKHRIYSAIPLIYFSLLQDGSVRKDYLNECVKFLALPVGQIDDKPSIKHWEIVKFNLIELWRCI